MFIFGDLKMAKWYKISSLCSAQSPLPTFSSSLAGAEKNRSEHNTNIQKPPLEARYAIQSLVTQQEINTLFYQTIWSYILGTNISPAKAPFKMIFLFPRWDMLVPWKVNQSKHLPIHLFFSTYLSINLCIYHARIYTRMSIPSTYQFLVGGFNPFEKY